MEIWFWNNSNWGVVFRRDKWGLNPKKPFYIEVTPSGEEAVYYSQGRKYEGGGSQSPVYHSSRETITDIYTYNPARKTGTFSQRTLFLIANSTHDAGASLNLSGRFSVRNNMLTVQNIVFSMAPNPFGKDSYQTAGRFRVAGGPFTKTIRQPSKEKDVQAGFSDYFPPVVMQGVDSEIPPDQAVPIPNLTTPF